MVPDVLKITAQHLPNLGYQEWDTGHGKLSAELDLRARANVEKLLGLVREVDVFAQGYRPGTLAARGLAPERLAEMRPGIVCVSLSAFGHAGPWASRRGFDTIVQTVSGITIRHAEWVQSKSPGTQFYSVSAIDYCTGYLMAFGAMVALGKRAQEGGSSLVRISLAQIGKWILDLGEVAPAALQAIPAEFTQEELALWSMVSKKRHRGHCGTSNPPFNSPRHRRNGQGQACRSVIISRSGPRDDERPINLTGECSTRHVRVVRHLYPVQGPGLSVRLPFCCGRCVGQIRYLISSCDRCPQTLRSHRRHGHARRS
jgi:CoA-transferase family III